MSPALVIALGVLLAERLPAQFQRACQMALGFRIQAEIFVGLPDRHTNRGFDQRLRLELALDAGRGAVERGAHLELRIRFRVRAGLRAGAGLRQQIVLQEIVHRFRGFGFAVGAIALLRDAARLDSHRGGEGDEHATRTSGGDRDADAMAPDELARPVDRARRAWRRRARCSGAAAGPPPGPMPSRSGASGPSRAPSS